MTLGPTPPNIIPADKLLVEPLLYSSPAYPLRHVEWLRIEYINWSETLVGTAIGLILATIAPIALQFLSSGSLPAGTFKMLGLEALVLLVFWIWGWLKDTKRRDTIRKISNFFDETKS